jgi:chaperone required for assembly of F1-ATPase
VRAARAGDALHVVATRPVKAGGTVLTLDGEEVSKPSRNSIQLDEGTHIEVTGDLPLEELMLASGSSRCWRHTCLKRELL